MGTKYYCVETPGVCDGSCSICPIGKPMSEAELMGWAREEQRLGLVPDDVNSPSHYKQGEIECIDYLRDNLGPEGFQYACEANVKKYMHRWRHKGTPVKDLRKARWYLDQLINEAEKNNG